MSDKRKTSVIRYSLKSTESIYFNNPDGFMLIFIKSGNGIFLLNGKKYAYEPGTAVILSCVDYFQKLADGSDTTLMALEFFDDVFSGRMLEFFNIALLPHILPLDIRFDSIAKLFDMLQVECSSRLKHGNLFAHNIIKELLIFTMDKSGQGLPHISQDIKTGLALLYTYAHFREPISLEQVASHIHYSANYFHHSFRKNTGIPFKKFLHNLRLTYSANLLLYTEASVSEVCFDSGFNSIQYFSTSFKKRFGCSPRDFRKAIKGDNQK